MNLRIGFLIFPDIQQLDMTGPYEVFAIADGVEVDLVWKDRNPVNSFTGISFTATTTFLEAPQFDVLCIPGGGGTNALMTDLEVLDFIRSQAKAVKFLTSVCTGSLVLGAAGLLKGRSATTHWNSLDLLTQLGATPVNKRVVYDDNIVTAQGVSAGIDFALSLLAKLIGQQEAEVVQLWLEYAPKPPFNSGNTEDASPAIIALARDRLKAGRAAKEALFATLTAP